MIFPAKNPKGTYILIAVLLTVGLMISFSGPGRLNIAIGLAPILVAVAGICGLQRSIHLDEDSLVIRFVAGEFRYPLNDITDVRPIADGKGIVDFFKGHPRVEIITKSGKSVTILPKEPDEFMSRLKR